jgi:hypothetical protein
MYNKNRVRGLNGSDNEAHTNAYMDESSVSGAEVDPLTYRTQEEQLVEARQEAAQSERAVAELEGGADSSEGDEGSQYVSENYGRSGDKKEFGAAKSVQYRAQPNQAQAWTQQAQRSQVVQLDQEQSHLPIEPLQQFYATNLSTNLPANATTPPLTTAASLMHAISPTESMSTPQREVVLLPSTGTHGAADAIREAASSIRAMSTAP